MNISLARYIARHALSKARALYRARARRALTQFERIVTIKAALVTFGLARDFHLHPCRFTTIARLSVFFVITFGEITQNTNTYHEHLPCPTAIPLLNRYEATLLPTHTLKPPAGGGASRVGDKWHQSRVGCLGRVNMGGGKWNEGNRGDMREDVEMIELLCKMNYHRRETEQ